MPFFFFQSFEIHPHAFCKSLRASCLPLETLGGIRVIIWSSILSSRAAVITSTGREETAALRIERRYHLLRIILGDEVLHLLLRHTGTAQLSTNVLDVLLCRLNVTGKLNSWVDARTSFGCIGG
jgi:hypothetical protein